MKKIFIAIALLISGTINAQVQFGGVIRAQNNAAIIGNIGRTNDNIKTNDSALNAKIPILTLVGTGLKVDGSAVTQPISIATMPSTPVTGTFFQTTQPVSIPAAVALTTASAAALNADVIVSTDVSAYKAVSLQLTGTWSGTITFQGSNDNITFQSINSEVNTAGGNALNTNISGLVIIPIKYKFLRVRMTAFTSGTATGTAIAYSDDRSNIYNNSTVSGFVSINGGSATIGAVVKKGTSVNGNTLSTLNAAATTNATLIKASAATVYTITIMNASAANRFVRIYNLTTAPTVGTSIPIMVIAIPATSSKELEFGLGIPFSVGLSYAITGAAAATDATAVAAGDVQLAISWN